MRVSLLCATLLVVAATIAAARHHPRPHVRHAADASPAAAAAAAASSCELPAGFVHLRDVAPTIIQEMRYGTLHNFMGRVVDMYEAPACILTTQAAQALAKVQQFLLSGAADPVNNQSFSLKMYDCYRPTGAVANFVSWASDLSDTLMQAEFYPTEQKSNLFADGYIAYHSGHSRGSTMDLTIVAMPAAGQPTYQPGVTVLKPCFAPVGVRWADNSIDMGTGFDCFSTVSWTNDTSIDVQAQFNRLMLLQAMTFVGNFINYDEEWWHYTLINEPYPNTSFNFTVCE